MRVPTANLLTAVAILVSVGSADLERALSIGRRSEAERARFHSPYVITLNDATVEQIEVVTEFRRAVMIVEERMRYGDRMYGLRQIEEALRPFHNRVIIRARLRFHPLNTLTTVPEYELRVGNPSDRLIALATTSRTPIYVQSGDSQALMGAGLEMAFDAGILGQTQLPISVVLDGRTVAATMFNFSAVE